MNLKAFAFILSVGLGLVAATHAEEVSDFDSLWKEVSTRSYGIQSEKSEWQAAEIAVNRSSRHWAPRLLLDARLVSTNDPGTTLFSTLKSRSLMATDLSPDVMNHPSREWFKQAGVTLDWSLFEGGSRVAMSRGARLKLQSHVSRLEAQMEEEYAELANEYAKLIALRSEVAAYRELKAKLESVLSRYRVGSRENPVGYSGLLGMRALLNRLEGHLSQSDTEIASIENSIRIRSGKESLAIRTPERQGAREFLESKLVRKEEKSRSSSLRAEAMRLEAEAHEEYSKAERARWLPKVGLFATESLNSGPRDTGTSTEFGAYLQWELFNAGNVGVYKESALRATAAEKKAEEMNQKSEIARGNLSKMIPVLRTNLKRLDESLGLTAEQTGVTEKLFRNGSINALQFVEVLSRRTDIVQNRRQAEFAYADSVAALYLQNASGK